jgi:hypothetical protein
MFAPAATCPAGRLPLALAGERTGERISGLRDLIED